MVKRVILCLSTFVFFVGSYLLYARTVVPLVELPPKELAANELPPTGNPDRARLESAQRRPGSSFEVRLAREVFGDDSWEAEAPIRMHWQRGITLFADKLQQSPDKAAQATDGEPSAKPFGDWTHPPEGEVLFRPFSMVFSSSEQDPTSLQCSEARLWFAKRLIIAPNTSDKDNEVLGGQLVGDVVVWNRRGTDDPNDDLHLLTRNVQFNRAEAKLWTDSPVEFRDGPNHGSGLGLELLIDDPGEASTRKQPAKPTRIRAVVLHRNIEMQLDLGQDGGFLGGNAGAPSAGPSMVIVEADGPFYFDMQSYTAVFRRNVRVTRPTADGQADTLKHCDRLEVVFARVEASEGDKQGDGSSSRPALVFRRLRATGERMELRSDQQDLTGVVTELAYDAETKTTLLASDTEVAVQQKTNEMHCRQLVMKQSDDARTLREVEALGPGWFRAKPEDGDGPLRVSWEQTMRSFPQGDFTVLAFTGNSHLERENEADLSADAIYLWIEPEDAGKGLSERSPAPGAPRFRIDRMLADGAVRMQSAQLNGEVERLEGWFEDAPTPVATVAPPSSSPVALPAAPRRDAPHAPTQEPKEPTSAANVKPLHVRARVLRFEAIRSAAAMQVSQVQAEGEVYAYREAASDDEKPMKLWGEKLRATDLGDQSGTAVIEGSPAHVESDALTLEAGNINLDYAKNLVWVNGTGSLELPVRIDPVEQKAVEKRPMRVDWKRRMFFNGEVAEFGGDIQMDADGRRIRCQNAQITLAQAISFRNPPPSPSPARRGRESEGAGGEQVKVKRVRCDEQVIFDADVVENGQLQGHDHAEVVSFDLDNETGETVAQGPGLFVQVRRGMTNPFAPENDARGEGFGVRGQGRGLGGRGSGVGARRGAPGFKPQVPNPKPQTPGERIRYTRIQFEDSMKGNSHERRTTFFGRVEVTYGPVDAFDAVVDPNHLPEQGIWMRSEQLEVLEHPPGASAKRTVEMRARGKVRVETSGYFADADRLDYDESKDQFVLEGTPNQPATLWRQERVGGEMSRQRARKITYWRREGRVQLSDGQDGSFVDLPERR